MAETRRQKYERQWGELRSERSTWDAHWRDLGENFAPRSTRFNTTERNRGTKKNGAIINSAPLTAARTQAAGMSGGLTSPARPWFRLTTPDPDLAESAGAKSWLHVVQERLYQVLQMSNIYSVLPAAYLGLGVFATHVLFIEEDPRTVLRGYTMPIGSYVLAAGADGRADTFQREYSMTPPQLVEKFGEERVSARVREDVKAGKRGAWRDVVHVVERNTEQQRGRRDYSGMPWRSCWYERCGETSASDVEFLREAGFWEAPFLAARWERTGEDVYGSNSPGMTALGDAKALQVMERRSGQLTDLLSRPPMRAPSSLRNQRASMIPGDTTYVDANTAGQTFEPSYIVNPVGIQELREDKREHVQRIEQAFYADLWLLLSRGDAGQITAREVAERHEEKLLQLGPVLESLNDELLSPLIDRTFGICQRAGLIPPPPPEVQGVSLTVQYVSILHQAQKLVDTAGMERGAGFVGNLAGVFGPQQSATPVTDVLNTDVLIREYAERLGLKPEIIRSPDEVAQIRAARAQQAQQAAQAQAAQAAAEGAKTLSEADTGGDNALTRVAGALGGQAAQVVPMRGAA
jgi:hypothetical protein